MAALRKAALGGGIGIARGVAAFTLNLIAAVLGPTNPGGFAHRFIRSHLPYVSAAQRELLVSIVFAGLIALCVSRFWSTTTAKWIWIVPLPVLLIRMAIFASGNAHSSVLEDLNYGFWRHFFNPDPSKGYKGFAEFTDFIVFTMGAVRAASYSFVAWVSPQWEQPGLNDPIVVPASDRPEPTRPMILSGPKLRWLTSTNLLIGINVALFAAMVASGISPLFPQTSQLVRWGANLGVLTLHGQYWRLITHAFLHFGIFHLAANMVCLWWIGRLAERIFGGFVLTGIYLLTAIGAGLLSLAWAPLLTSAGASGAILGIAGALIAVVLYGKLKLPPREFFYRRIIVFVCYFLLPTPGTDNMAHLGGFATGLLLGFFFARSLRTASSHPVFAAARLFQGREAIERHAYDSAVQHLQIYLDARPNAADGHALLGYSFHALQRYDDAIQEYQLALTLGCADEGIEANLAQVCARQGGPEDSVALIQRGHSSSN